MGLQQLQPLPLKSHQKWQRSSGWTGLRRFPLLRLTNAKLWNCSIWISWLAIWPTWRFWIFKILKDGFVSKVVVFRLLSQLMSQDTSRLSTEGVANVEFTTLATYGHFERGGWGFWEVSSGRCMDDPILRKSDVWFCILFGGRIPNLSRIRFWKGSTFREIGPKDQGNTYNPTRSSHTFKAATRHPWQPLKYLWNSSWALGMGLPCCQAKMRFLLRCCLEPTLSIVPIVPHWSMLWCLHFWVVKYRQAISIRCGLWPMIRAHLVHKWNTDNEHKYIYI